ncbi:MAG: twin-arginine translocase subunit TatC [Gammaproteobacteria bacterium]|nr:twin-arginine translocase subunit TatC [Gammaproteobacteria bacterium]
MATGKGASPGNDLDPTEQSFVSHLAELRTRLMRAIVCVLAVLLVLMPLSNQLYGWLSRPMMEKMKAIGAQMIATEVASPFLAPFKLTCFVAVVLCVPYIFYQLWAFVAPGLYRHEKRLAFPLLVSSISLFYLGGLFAYYVVFPLIFGFLTAAAPEGVQVMTDISKYLDFVIVMFFAFGIAFEVPVATFLVVRTGISTRQDLARKRPYIIIGAFIAAAVLTPPDPVSQTLMAIPILVLYELGLLMCRIFITDEEEAAGTELSTTGPGGDQS